MMGHFWITEGQVNIKAGDDHFSCSVEHFASLEPGFQHSPGMSERWSAHHASLNDGENQLPNPYDRSAYVANLSTYLATIPSPSDPPPVVDPNAPRVQEALSALLASAVFARVTNVAASSNPVAVYRGDIAVNLALAMASTPQTTAFNAAIANLATALTNSALLGANALTNAEKTWLTTWNTTHKLGLTFPWS